MYMTVIIKKPIIERITHTNFSRYKRVLEAIMKKEFPPNERLTPEQIKSRVVLTPRENKENYVYVLTAEDAYSMVISPHMMENGQTLGLIEYCATFGNSKGKGLGKRLIEHLLNLNISSQYVLETEAVPRMVQIPIHSDIKRYYKINKEYIILNGQANKKALEGIEKRNRFWERSGFEILEPVGYCQPQLDTSITEVYTGQFRVPLDLQILSGNKSISKEELVRIIRLLAINYEDVITPEDHVKIATRSHDAGEFNLNEKITPIPFLQLWESDRVKTAIEIIAKK